MKYIIFCAILLCSGCGATSKIINLSFEESWIVNKRIIEKERGIRQGAVQYNSLGKQIDPIYDKSKGYIKVNLPLSTLPVLTDAKYCHIWLKELERDKTLVKVNVIRVPFLFGKRYRDTDAEAVIIEKISKAVNLYKIKRDK